MDDEKNNRDEIMAKLNRMVAKIKDDCNNELTVKNYLKKAFDFCVEYCDYDATNSEKIKKMIEDGESETNIVDQYNKYFNIDRVILSGTGVCQQFAFLYVILACCAESGIKVPDGFSLVYNQCKIILESGATDPHSIIIIKYNGEKYYIDLSMAIKLKHSNYRDDFFMKSLPEYQQSLIIHDKSSYDSVVCISFENNLPLEELYNIISQQLYKKKDLRVKVYKLDS